MYFSEESITQLRAEFGLLDEKYRRLLELYVSRSYKDMGAHEHATQGFARRLGTLVRCIENVFETLPPERTAIPDRNELVDAAINIQAFLFNVFGIVDNLAWIWVLEKQILDSKGKKLAARNIGLTPKCDAVRASFSAEFQDYLSGFNNWFDYLENYRHALAHRIPLYIPPYTISPKNEKAYRDLDASIREALMQRNRSEYQRLKSEQEHLKIFMPWIKHSFLEQSKPFIFHPQLLTDFDTVVELGQKLIEELDC
jgi:hypothetical protein